MLGKKKRLIKSEQINSVNSIKPLRHSKTDNCGYIIAVFLCGTDMQNIRNMIFWT